MAHWYKLDGTLVNGATVRDARKHNLYPSVTTVLGILAKPGLDIWKTDQAILSALTFPNPDNAKEYELLKLIKDDSKEQSKVAMEKGTLIHNLTERIIKKDEIGYSAYKYELMSIDDEFENKILKIAKSIEFTFYQILDKPIYIEESFVDLQYGFAGRPDLLSYLLNNDIGLFDHKTQSTKKGEKIKKYPEWLYQLAACNILTCRQANRFFNTVISTTEPGRVELVEWKQAEIDHAEEVFLTMLKLFKLIKKI
ncbi:MAG: hypothetical protein GY853_05885 [PVC group bacterium]|nr:hypothetical protein [PVC group bacterium]